MKSIEDNAIRPSAMARKRVEDAQKVIKQEHEVMDDAENTGLTTTGPDVTFDEMFITSRDCLRDLDWSDDDEDGDDEEDGEDIDLGKLSTDYKPKCVMGTISI